MRYPDMTGVDGGKVVDALQKRVLTKEEAVLYHAGLSMTTKYVSARRAFWLMVACNLVLVWMMWN